MVSVFTRLLWVVFACLLWPLQTAVSADEGEPNVADRYLQPQAAWPAMHELADEDVAAVPQTEALNTYLVELGETLFHDPGLSRDSSVSCASCHQAEFHFADNQRISPGVEGRLGARTSPMLRLVSLWDVLFWDARVDSLEALVEHPLTDPLEMDNTTAAAVAYVSTQDDYAPAFVAAFGDQTVNWPRIAEAIAGFMRSIPAPRQRFDIFMQAIETHDFVAAAEALSEQEREGLHLFRGKAGCVQCHSGALMSDQRLHNTGLTYYGRTFEDLGHYNVSGRAEDVGKFRTPSLRYLGERNHFMHNGLFDDMRGIVRMYAHGGSRPRPRGEQVNDPLFPQTSELLKPFDLSKQEEQALLAFLQTL